MSKRYSFKPSKRANEGSTTLDSPSGPRIPFQDNTTEQPEQEDIHPDNTITTNELWPTILSTKSATTNEQRHASAKDFEKKLADETIQSVANVIRHLPLLCSEVFSSGYSLGIRSAFTLPQQDGDGEQHQVDNVSLHIAEYLQSHISGKSPLPVSSVSSLSYDSSSIEDGQSVRELLGSDQIYTHEVVPLEHATDRTLLIVHELQQLSQDIQDIQSWTKTSSAIDTSTVLHDQHHILTQSSSILYGLFYQLLTYHQGKPPTHIPPKPGSSHQTAANEIEKLLVEADAVVEGVLDQSSSVAGSNPDDDKIAVYQHLFDYYGTLCPFSLPQIIQGSDNVTLAYSHEEESKDNHPGISSLKKYDYDQSSIGVGSDNTPLAIHAKLFRYGRNLVDLAASRSSKDLDKAQAGPTAAISPSHDPQISDDSSLSHDHREIKQKPKGKFTQSARDGHSSLQQAISEFIPNQSEHTVISAGPDPFTQLYPPKPDSFYESFIAFSKVILVTIFICIIALTPAFE